MADDISFEITGDEGKSIGANPEDTEGNGKDTYATSQPSVLNGMASARSAGYQWNEIDQHLATARAGAVAGGYSDNEVDNYLGYQPPHVAAANFQAAWQQRAAQEPDLVSKLTQPTAPNTAAPIDLAAQPGTRSAYASALLDGSVKGPQDFAQLYGQSLGDALNLGDHPAAQDNIAKASAALATQLPDPRELTDAAVGLVGAGHYTFQSNPPNAGSENSNFTPAQVFTRNKAYAKPGPYITQLSPDDEQQFQAWAKQHDMRVDAPDNQTSDYDMRGFWKAQQEGDPDAKASIDPNDHTMHEPDKWKTPYDLTFSRESQYATEGAPEWNDKDQLVLPNGQVVYDDRNRTPYIGTAPQNLVSTLQVVRANLMQRWADTGINPLQSWSQAQTDPMISDALKDPGAFKDGAPPPQSPSFLSAIGHAIAKGFGTPQAMDPETEKWFEDVGIFPGPQGGGIIRLANKGVIAGVSAGFSLMGAAFNAGAAGAAEAVKQGELASGETENEAEQTSRHTEDFLQMLGVYAMASGFAPGEVPHAGAVAEGLAPLMRDMSGAGRNPFFEAYQKSQGKEPPLNAPPLPAGAEGNVEPDEARQLHLGLQNTTSLPPKWTGLSKQAMGGAEARVRDWMRQEALLKAEKESMAAHGAPVESPLEVPQQLALRWREESLQSGELFTPDEMGPRIEPPGKRPGDLPIWVPEDPAKLARDAVAEMQGRDTRPAVRPPEWTPFPAEGDLKPYMTGLEDDLYKLRSNATADHISLYQMADALPKEMVGDSGFQSRVSRENERRLVDPEASVSKPVQEFLDAVKPLTDEQTALATQLKRLLGDRAQDDLFLSQLHSTEEGYVRRFVAEPETGVDPVTGVGDVIVEGNHAGRRQIAPASTKHRAFYVMQWGDQREWGEAPLSTLRDPETGKPVTYGHKVTDAQGNEWTVRQATMDEVEAHTDVKYNDNFLMNTVLNVAQLRRSLRNVQLLQNVARILGRDGLFLPRDEQAPEGWVRTNAPFLDGWMHPRIGKIVNDFYDPQGHTVMQALAKVAKIIISSMFVSPVTHIANVGAHAFVGRGWDWIHSGRIMSAGARAVREVTTMGPLYQEMLRNGNGLLYADTRMQNFHEMLLRNLFNEQLADEGGTWSGLAKALQFDHITDLVKAEYRMSRQILWGANDVFMMQRVIELMDGGLPMKSAIKVAEKDIPNYRVPSEVLHSPLLSDIMRSPSVVAFGRYRHGQLAAIGHMAKDLVRPETEAAPAEFLPSTTPPGEAIASRKEALGKVIALAALGLGVYPLLNKGLQSITGNENASFHYAGPLTPIAGAASLLSGQKSWMAMTGSVATLNPIVNLIRTVLWNQNPWGRPIVSGNAKWQAAIGEGLEAALNTLYPGQQLLQAIKPGGMEKVLGQLLLNANIPTTNPAKAAAAQRRELGEERSREEHDSFIKWITSTLGGEPLANVSSGTYSGGSGMSNRAPGSKRNVGY